MKVIFLTTNMAGGGAERVTALLLEWLYKNDTEIRLITDTLTSFAYHINIPSSHIDSLFYSSFQKSGHFSFFYMIKNVRKILKREKPDVIVGIMPWMVLVAFLAKMGLSCKLVASHHTSFSRPVHFHIAFIKNIIYPFASAVTILTQADATYLGNRLPKRVVMPNPLSFPVLKEYRQEIRRKNILAVGRLDVWNVKGFDILIKSWSLIADKYPDWVLEIAGEGSEKSQCYLQELSQKLNIESQVHFLGFRQDIDTVMRESSIFVLSSRIEGFGMVLIEAMSQGCACVSFDDGGRQREIIRNNQEGIIVENRTPEDLSSTIEMLMTDDDLRSEIAMAGVERAKDYDLSLIAKRWKELFGRLSKTNKLNR